MPLEIHQDVVITAETEPVVVLPGELHFIQHELLNGTHYLGVQCNEANDGGVVRDFLGPKVPSHAQIAIEGVLQTLFSNASYQRTIDPGRALAFRLINDLGYDELYTIVHTPTPSAE